MMLSAKSLQLAALLYLAVVPLAFGAAHLITNVVLATVMLVVAVMALLAAFCGRRLTIGQMPIPISNPLLWLIVITLVVTVGQVLPLPIYMMAQLSPHTSQLWLMGSPSSFWVTLSIAPVATAHEILKIIQYVSLLIITGCYSRDVKFRRVTLTVIVSSALCVAVVGFVHFLLGISQSFGQFGRSDLITPTTLINPNHAAGFYGFAAFLALGLSVRSCGVRKRLYQAAAVFLSVALAATLSRGGMVTYIAVWLCAATYFWLFLRSNKTSHHGDAVCFMGVTRKALPIIFTTTVALIYGLYHQLNHSRVMDELLTIKLGKGEYKVSMWVEQLPLLLKDFFMWGVGKGAFGSVSPKYLALHNERMTHIENEWLQPLVDFGVPLGILLVVSVCFVLFMVWRTHRRSWEGTLYCLGLLYLALQNAFTFGLELPGLMAPAIAVCALLYPEHRTNHDVGAPHSKTSTVEHRARIYMVALIALFCSAWLVSICYTTNGNFNAEYNALSTKSASNDISFQQFENAAMEVLSRYPTSYLIPLLVANRALRQWEKDLGQGATSILQRGIGWVKQARFFNPSEYLTHVVEGELLWALHRPTQSIASFQQACRLAPNKGRTIAARLTALSGNARAVIHLQIASAVARIELASYLLDYKLPALALDMLGGESDAHADKYNSSYPRYLTISSQAHFLLQNYDAAEQLAQELISLTPDYPKGYAILAQVFSAQQRVAAALDILTEGLSKTAKVRPLLLIKTELLLAGKDFPLALQAAEQLIFYSYSDTHRAEAFFLQGRAAVLLHDYRLALRSYGRSLELDDSVPKRYLALILLRMKMGDTKGARELFFRARIIFPKSKLFLPALVERNHSTSDY